MSELSIVVAERVREEREGAGMSQSDLARFAGISRRGVVGIERGRLPKLGALERVAMVLAVPVASFLEDPEHETA